MFEIILLCISGVAMFFLLMGAFIYNVFIKEIEENIDNFLFYRSFFGKKISLKEKIADLECDQGYIAEKQRNNEKLMNMLLDKLGYEYIKTTETFVMDGVKKSDKEE